MKQLLITIAAAVLVGCGAKAPEISIHEAASQGNIEVIKKYLEAGLDINVYDDQNMSPLDRASIVGKWDTDSIKSKKKLAVDIIKKAGGVHNSIIGSMFAADIESIQHFLDQNIDINTKWEMGSTLVYHSCNQGNIEVVKYLISMGADINIANNNGGTPLHRACNFGDPDLVGILIDAGANIDAIDGQQLSPLHVACMSDKLNIVELLISKGSNINLLADSKITGHLGTPLDVAIWNQRSETAKLLRKHGAKTGEELKAEVK